MTLARPIISHLAAVSLGSNLGDRMETLAGAFFAIEKLPQCCDFRFSSIYESVALDCPEPLEFLNAAAVFQTTLTPLKLLALLQQIEKDFGRQRSYQNAPRTLDLDLLLYNEHIIATDILVLPHPRLQDRLFVLDPLSEILSEAFHPVLRKTIATLQTERRFLTGALEKVIVVQSR